MKSVPAPHPSDAPAPVLRECAICQTAVYPAEATTPCPKCGLVYHAECWQHNLGCASYGCDQVNALAPKLPAVIPSTSSGQDAPLLAPPADLPVERIPWSFVLLGAAAVSVALSALCFGIPSLATVLVIAARMHRKRSYRDRVLIAAAALAIVGVVAGIILSRFWWRQE
ncbi:MAG: hypothetical protein ABIP55_08200 [Tepidisphaeraceae bacterium]